MIQMFLHFMTKIICNIIVILRSMQMGFEYILYKSYNLL